jgi:pimeloyl-ACP methyl ester carboxylesterase
LAFDVSVAGADDAPLVLLLHGFCVSRHFWNNQLPALAQAGYFAVAPNQRGYSVDARPAPQVFDNYRVDRLIGDALDIVAATGYGERRFHLVGHDWGGSLAWLIADRYPEHLASLTMLSRPHPSSFARTSRPPGRDTTGNFSTRQRGHGFSPMTRPRRDTAGQEWGA